MIRKILVAIVAFVVLTILAIVVALNYRIPDKEDTFYLADAEPLDPEYLYRLDHDLEESFDRKQFGFGVHRLKPGRGTIFAYRLYSDGVAAVIDDEHYRKLTVWIPSGAPPSRTEFQLHDRTKVVVTYSEGGSAWPRADCSAYVSRGTLIVVPDGKVYRVAISGESEPHGNTNTRCASQPIQIEFEAESISFGRLTPWLGLAGDHPYYSETYRFAEGLH